jgi:hypothetical protein
MSNPMLSYPFQRKTFYANTRYWAWYTDGTNMVYRTSTDGSTWSSTITVRACIDALNFAIWFDDAYVHYAYTSTNTAEAILYRRGAPNNDGSITWSAAEQTVVSGLANIQYFKPNVSTDSNGHPWIGYAWLDKTSNAEAAYATKSSTKDGTWSTEPGFPYKLANFSFGDKAQTSIIPLSGGKMLAIYTSAGYKVSSRPWNGIAWGAEAQTLDENDESYSVVPHGDDAHLVFRNGFFDGLDIVHSVYTYASNSWSTESMVEEIGVPTMESPTLTINPANDSLYCFWSGGSSNNVYYRKFTSSWGPRMILATESSTPAALYISSFYQVYANRIGVLYVIGSYSLRFNALDLTRIAEGVSSVRGSVIEATAGSVYMVYPDYDPSHTKGNGAGAAALSDFTALGFVYGMTVNTQVQSLDTSPTYVTQSNGKPLVSGKGIVLVGGQAVHACVRYYENQRIAPVYPSVEGTMYYWYTRAGVKLTNTAMDSSLFGNGISYHQDMFVVECFIDPDGNTVFIIYGYGWKGSFAGGEYFKSVIYPNIGTYTHAYYIYQWVDANNDGFPDLNEITPVTNGD